MYHSYSKDNPYLRKALYEAHKHKCVYCGDLIIPKNMHVDHILATNAELNNDTDLNKYIKELNENGFIIDSIENYMPSCSSCNLRKNNRNFSVGNFRFFHQLALENAEKVLSYIEDYKIKNCDFPDYNPDYDYWEKIDFVNQHDISYAISGYRLTDADVVACPRLKQVEEIKKQLEIVNHVLVQGESGCGKSISAYQAAYDFSKQGWTVYRYINKNVTNEIFVPPTEDGNEVLIIDDAQNIAKYLIEKVITQTRNNIKLIITQTLHSNNEKLENEPIVITNVDAVKAIASNYRGRLQEILPIVRQFDDTIGDDMFSISLESRLKNAMTKSTPWQFNYTLRGGWNKTKDIFQNVCGHRQCGFLAGAIALFQILLLDTSIDFVWLSQFFQEIEPTTNWNNEDLNYLIQKKLVISQDDVRIIHIESARIILSSYFKLGTDVAKKALVKAVQQAVEKRIVTVQGLIWLQSYMFAFNLNFDRIFFNDLVLNKIFSEMEDETDPEKRGYLLYFLERMIAPGSKTVLNYCRNNKDLLVRWISDATSKNAYAYSQLVNGLINNDKELLEYVSGKIEWNKIALNLSNSEPSKLYDWGNLINRLCFNAEHDKKESIFSSLIPAIINVSQSVTANNVEVYFAFLTRLYYLNPKICSELLVKKINEFRSLLMTDFIKGYSVFDFEFLSSFCGLNYFKKITRTKEQKKISKKLIDILPVGQFAKYVENSKPRDWHGLYDILRLLIITNSVKIEEVVNNIDYNNLIKVTAKYWQKTDNGLHLLFAFIAYGSIERAKVFFDANKDKIEELDLPFIKFLPQESIELFSKGVKINLFEQGWVDETLLTIKSMEVCNKSLTEKILYSTMDQSISYVENISYLTFELDKALNLLEYLATNYTNVFYDLCSRINIEKFSNSATEFLNDSRTAEREIKRFRKFVDLIALQSSEDNVKLLRQVKYMKNKRKAK